jgi:aminoglycoside phosphotransferase (APT) family kinase protein
MHARFVRMIALAALMLAAVACTPKLDTDQLEATLKDHVAQDTGADVTSVECPEVKAETGNTFQCMAFEASGSTFVLRVTQNDDKGNVSYAYIDAAAGNEATPTPSADASTPT